MKHESFFNLTAWFGCPFAIFIAVKSVDLFSGQLDIILTISAIMGLFSWLSIRRVVHAFIIISPVITVVKDILVLIALVIPLLATISIMWRLPFLTFAVIVWFLLPLALAMWDEKMHKVTAHKV